mmetsp:Transcript_6072/g.7456  ORF Transcript_6072/g.7456 Transcript_6072/m.7456 type:complete len:300 (+) Transcript_6072:69-968(+)|eukprot:CAMPEP_0195268568 /NCGR_PEP_ID=MMETSP0706-20130129/13256_1 /TAXON_ID=33640 /ORGANISM="Asterionellopsis glacialis, Strain CCMP134" /LENGTH=299 /DNA_ID=CAMNT_0040323521 /DNA_START=145 /DNA_END=1044 /DNA_ORIENTATION=-
MYRPPPPQYRNQQQQGQVIQVPSVNDVGSLVVRGAVTFAKRHKVISGSYIVGLLVLLLVGSGTKLTLDQQRQYNHIMSTIDLQAEFEASNAYAIADQNYRATKGWFTCDSLCQRNKDRMEYQKQILDDIRAEGHARMSDAKAVAGLFSEVGIGEVKDSFWNYFSQGKQFAKRQSMWDAMFIGMRHMGRDESTMEYVLKVLMQVLINFTMGLFMALGIFIFGLWKIINDYQPNPITAVLFFVLGVCGAFAFVTTYLMGIFGATAGGIYGVVKLAENNQRQARLQQQRGGGGYVHNRPHYQ